MSGTNNKLRSSVVFCDDIRQENNGKLLLVGVYSETLTTPIPSDVWLSAWAKIEGIKIGTYQVDIRYKGPLAGNMPTTSGELAVHTTELPTNLYLPPALLKIEAEGHLDLQMSIDGGGFQTLGGLRIGEWVDNNS